MDKIAEKKEKKWPHFVLYVALFLILLYSRFVNIRWGLPYPFHPDERNIANAIQNLTCHIDFKFSSWGFLKECLNPKFFAYGQFSIYLGYALALVSRLYTHLVGPIQFDEAVVAIRLIAAVASMLTVWAALKIVKVITDSFLVYLTAYLLLIFSPAAIQFAHFGTTESLLMLFYTLIIYVCIRFAREEVSMGTFAGACGFLIGMAAGAKISSLIFAILPFSLFLFPRKKKAEKIDFKTHIKILGERLLSLIIFGTTIVAVTFATSFYSFLASKEALSALDYESAVALGKLEVFYTRTFAHTIPVIFHFMNVFPFALGWLMTVLFALGFFILPWKREQIVMRMAFLFYFLPTAFTFTKWTRFMAPIFPLMVLFGVFTLFWLYDAGVNFVRDNPRLQFGIKNASLMVDSLFFSVAIAALMIPGLAYLTIYQTPDVRYQASEWIFKNVKPDARIVEETANVIDIPIPPPGMEHVPPTNYGYVSFNFYDLDADPSLPIALQKYIDTADYIFIPSRRIFANHTCLGKSLDVCQQLRRKYPILNNYYDGLFSGQLGFKQVAEFSSYPRIELFGKTILELPDEVAEETWTVFDHPVIRIYKRTP
ncbi:glycosyltransferase family 39 protein [Candidatus Microgenomates bacterium]|nr:glycosyltransferase family 39 protein [Candidatus Microgenomates bacterium]